MTGKWLDRIKNGHPFRARLSSIWQCFVLVRRGRPKVRGCASGTCTSRVSGFISYLPACVLPCYRVKWINAAPHAPVAALLNKRIWQSPYLMSTEIVQFPSRHPLYRMHALGLLQAGEQRGSGWILVNGAWMVNSSPPLSCLRPAAQSHTMAFYVRVQLQPIRSSGLPPLQLDSTPPSGHIYSSAHSVCSSVQRAAVGWRDREPWHWQTHKHCEWISTFPSLNCLSSQSVLLILSASLLLCSQHPVARWAAPRGTSLANRRWQRPQPWKASCKKEHPKSQRCCRP